MELTTAIRLVCADVDEHVYQRESYRLALQYARVDVTPAELDILRTDLSDPDSVYHNDDNFLIDGTRDVYGAYVAVRNATDVELDAAVAELRQRFTGYDD